MQRYKRWNYNLAPRQNQGCDTGRKSERKCIERFRGRMIVNVIEQRPGGLKNFVLMFASEKEVGVNNRVVIVAGMDVLERRQAQRLHQRTPQLQCNRTTHTPKV